MAIWLTERHTRLTGGDRKEMGGMRQDDRGITLVEMIIAVAVSVIVIASVSLFIRNVVQGYGLATDAIDLQIEAQVLMEQLATWVMEGNYVDDKVMDSSGKNVFVIYHIPRKMPDDLVLSGSWEESELMGERWIRIFRCDGNGKLYMYKADADSDDVFSDPTVEGSKLDGSIWTDETNWHLLSDYVEKFTVDIKPDNGLPNKVTVTLSMKAGIQKYELTDEINIRNTSYIPAPESP